MDWFREICNCPSMQRIREIGMNCGCEYTAFHRFPGIGAYSRYSHSEGVGRIVWQHTGDRRQSIAALLHDVATPVFAHVIDFMHGDHMKQESTEDRTLQIIASDREMVAALRRLSLRPEDVCDYHIFPIADNDTPKLSADRLEYSLGNMVNYRFASREKAEALYADIVAGVNEEGEPELMFRSSDAAEEFASLSLKCSKVYVSDEDRYAMQMLAELVRKYVDNGVLTEADLWTTEPDVIGKITAVAEGAADWAAYRGLHDLKVCGPDKPAAVPSARRINAKKRYINPYVQGLGRVTDLSPGYSSALKAYLDRSFDYWITAE